VCVCVYVCMYVALVIQRAMHMRHIVICGLFGFVIFFPRLIKGTVLGKKLLNMEWAI
jgi:hypothetical protein